MLLLKAGAKPTESSLQCYPLSGNHPEPVVVYGSDFDHRIIEYKVGSDLKDHANFVGPDHGLDKMAQHPV